MVCDRAKRIDKDAIILLRNENLADIRPTHLIRYQENYTGCMQDIRNCEVPRSWRMCLFGEVGGFFLMAWFVLLRTCIIVGKNS